MDKGKVRTKEEIKELFSNIKPPKKYWHKMTDEEYHRLIKTRATIKDVMETYMQPDWCRMPNAVHPVLGCWSLKARRVSNDTCGECGFYNGKA